MVGGHLDSWISGTGATDNGAGSIVAMEAVRILKALGVKPKRTIRIALWSGEEQGLFGSLGYVKQHFGTFAEPEERRPDALPSVYAGQGALTTTKEWETLDAYYNLDNGTGKVRGVYTQENFAIGPIFKQWIAPLADLRGDDDQLSRYGWDGPSFVMTRWGCRGSSSFRTRWTTTRGRTTRIWIRYDRLHPLGPGAGGGGGGDLSVQHE